MKYVPAYLNIIKSPAEKFGWDLLYLDGFAGSGAILSESDQSEEGDEFRLLEGVATQVLRIDEPRRFDHYFFVEKNPTHADRLRKLLDEEYSEIPSTKTVETGDFNSAVKKVMSRVKRRKQEGKIIKVLCFVDPYGMAVDWASIASMQGVDVDLWVLIPSGIGANRLLTKKFEKLNDAWLARLSSFLGVGSDEIKEKFYAVTPTLFGEDVIKEKDAVARIHQLFDQKLLTVFKYVSKPFIMENSIGSLMYHFVLASNNSTAVEVADSIINKAQGISKL